MGSVSPDSELQSLSFSNRVLALVVTFNGEKYIRECLRRLLESELPTDVLVVDNNSSDQTTKIIADEFPEVHLYHSQRNLGFGRANNVGMRQFLNSDMSYLFLVNQDLYVEPDTIGELIKLMEGDSEIDISGPVQLDGTGENVDFMFRRYLARFTPTLLDDFLLNGKLEDFYPTRFINAAAWMMSKDCVRKLGVFDPLFPHYGEDTDYLNRARFHGSKVCVAPNVFVRHDRPQVRNVSGFRKKSNWHLVKNFIVLKDVNENIVSAIGRLHLKLVHRTAKELFVNRDIVGLLALMSASFRTVLALPKILRHRGVSSGSDGAFICNGSNDSNAEQSE
ncbi:glycosyltransferase family 2 protein [Mariniblastus fucicola]|uniref:Undecaprenyl-phosphate mannosyltransferase n=1 Tax=Mariniblastus fucicola TaxID=980251 RepID=A0A5B9P5N8_9BACT|nr:glycosyltransferase family 2 protein [Mariniblastus fucicola]QEG20292.1 Undecaprenyl-phosphate mannosyltransferase [Mariniblastus fucicola]